VRLVIKKKYVTTHGNMNVKEHKSNRVRLMILMKCVSIIRVLLYFTEYILLVDILKIGVVYSIGRTVIV